MSFRDREICQINNGYRIDQKPGLPNSKCIVFLYLTASEGRKKAGNLFVLGS